MKFSGPWWKIKIFFKAFWKPLLIWVGISIFFIWALASFANFVSSIERQDIVDGSARVVVKTEKFFDDLKTKVDELRKENSNYED